MKNDLPPTPLADRMRPRTLDEIVGQEKIIGPKTLLRRAILDDKTPSLILWGPAGCGKTTLARVIAATTRAEFVPLSAVASGVKDLRETIAQAQANRTAGKRTIVFVDEIHRWNKTQQDALLPMVENGTIILIGATTENPSFEIRSALLSRCRVIVMEPLTRDAIRDLLQRAINDPSNGIGKSGKKFSPEHLEVIAALSNGDARSALNTLEYLATTGATPSEKTIREAVQKSHLIYDKDGEEHYNIISALHKSLRGSDADAALYYLARMLEGGEDPLYIARRLVRFASEDIGIANSRALEQTVAAYNACHFLGMPECNVILAQATVYLAKCKKSNALYTAYKKAAADVATHGNLPVPLHLRNAPTKLMKHLDYGKDYKYSPDFAYQETQEYFPPELKGRRYFE